MKALLKEIQFLLNTIDRHTYHYGKGRTNSYKLASKIGTVLARLEADDDECDATESDIY